MAAAVTVTDSVTLPTARRMSSRGICCAPTSTGFGDRRLESFALYRGLVATRAQRADREIAGVAGGTPANIWLVSTLVTATLAPGTTAPLGSRTLMTSPPESCCAQAASRHRQKQEGTDPEETLIEIDITDDSLPNVCIDYDGMQPSL